MRDRPVGELLREWRHRRRLSQLDLAIHADVSARHVSFVETGRTTPSRAMVLHLAEQLGVPLDDPDLAKAGEAVAQLLRAHEPFPALALDRHWNVVSTNTTVDVLFDGVAPELLEPPVNMMRLGLHPRGFALRLANLAQVRAFLLSRLARQAAQTGDPELAALHAELRTYGADESPPPPDPAEALFPADTETARFLSAPNGGYWIDSDGK